MKALRGLFPPFVGGRIGIGLLVLRVVVGLGIAVHGFGKITNATGWMNQPGKPPAAIPGFMQALAAMGEFFGGLGLLVGALTPIAALGVICTMIGALLIAQLPAGHPWISMKPGGDSWEDVGFYLFGALALMLAGPGLFSVDAALFGRRNAERDEVALPGERVRSRS